MNVKTFQGWLAESVFSEQGAPSKITCIAAWANDATDLEKVVDRLQIALRHWDVTAPVIWYTATDVLDQFHIWFGWDSLQEWGDLVNLEEERFSPTNIQKAWKEANLTVHSARNDYDAVKLLLTYSAFQQEAPAEELIWLKGLCDRKNWKDLSEKITGFPNWPEDPAEWAWGEW